MIFQILTAPCTNIIITLQPFQNKTHHSRLACMPARTFSCGKDTTWIGILMMYSLLQIAQAARSDISKCLLGGAGFRNPPLHCVVSNHVVIKYPGLQKHKPHPLYALCCFTTRNPNNVVRPGTRPSVSGSDTMPRAQVLNPHRTACCCFSCCDCVLLSHSTTRLPA